MLRNYSSPAKKYVKVFKIKKFKGSHLLNNSDIVHFGGTHFDLFVGVIYLA